MAGDAIGNQNNPALLLRRITLKNTLHVWHSDLNPYFVAFDTASMMTMMMMLTHNVDV